MNHRLLATVLTLVSSAAFTGCAVAPRQETAVGPPSGAYASVQYGQVIAIEVLPVAARSSGGGAVIGAVVGAVIGNQVGQGSGRAVATGIGAVGGAVVGDVVERRRQVGEGEIYRIGVRFDNGSVGHFDYRRIDDLRVGDRVRLEGGQLFHG